MAKSKQPRSKKCLSKSVLIISPFLFFSFSLAFTLFTIPFILLPSDPRHTTHRVLTDNSEADHDHEPWAEVISWQPRAALYHNFLTHAECEHLINISIPHLQRAYVVNSKTGESIASRARTSYGHFLSLGQDEIINSIEERLAEFTFIPKENGEGLQVLRYEKGQEYKPHQDYFIDEFNMKRGGQRIATVLMYLSEVEEGGETVFPFAVGNFSTQRNDLSECAKTGLAVKPRMGDALLFWSMKPDGSPDSKSIHAGCPVIKGTKWSATKWLRMREFK